MNFRDSPISVAFFNELCEPISDHCFINFLQGKHPIGSLILAHVSPRVSLPFCNTLCSFQIKSFNKFINSNNGRIPFLNTRYAHFFHNIRIKK